MQDKENIVNFLDFEGFHFVFKAVWFRGFKKATSFDLISNFLKFKLIRITLLRLGITNSDFENFLENYNQTNVVSFETIIEKSLAIISMEKRNIMSLSDVLVAIFEEDEEFQQFLFKFKVKKRELKGVLSWVIEISNKERESKAWCSTDNLFYITGIASDWAYGVAYNFNKYAIDITYQATAIKKHKHLFGRNREIMAIERILLKSCATPDVIMPIEDNFSDCNNVSSIFLRSVMSRRIDIKQYLPSAIF